MENNYFVEVTINIETGNDYIFAQSEVLTMVLLKINFFRGCSAMLTGISLPASWRHCSSEMSIYELTHHNSPKDLNLCGIFVTWDYKNILTQC
jgi:hypothetical protein